MPASDAATERPPVGLRSLPTVFHITHYKAGSQWVYQLLDSLAPGRIILPQPSAAHVLAQPIVGGMIYPTAYVTREQFERLKQPERYVKFVLVRDLRDTLVSWYFHLSSNQSEEDRSFRDRTREHANLVSVQEGMGFVMGGQLLLAARIQRSWLNTGTPIFRYEDMLEKPEEQLGWILRICEIEAEGDEIRDVLRNNSFERMSGRRRGNEDVSSFFRKGVAGDWKNYVSGSLARDFDERFGDLLIATGYEKDHNWASAQIPVAGSPPAKPKASLPAGWNRESCWCGGSLEPFGGGYGRCVRCRTVVALSWTAGDGVAAGTIRPEVSDPMILEQFIRRDLLGYEAETTIELLRAATGSIEPGGRVLEVKAQSGVLSELLAKAGYDAMAVEMDVRLTRLADEIFEVPVVAGPLERCQEELGTFASIIMPRLVSQLPNPVETLKAARELLDDDGVLILTDRALIDRNDSYDAALARGSALLDELDPMRHRVFLYSQPSFRALLSAAGFTDHRLNHYRRLNQPAFEYRPQPFIASAAKVANTEHQKQHRPHLHSGTADDRVASLLLGMRDDLAQLTNIREGERTRAAEQLQRMAAYHGLVSRRPRAKRIDSKHWKRRAAHLAERFSR